MTIPRYAQLAAKLLQRDRDSVARAASPAPEVRDDALAALERAIVKRGRRQRLRRTAYPSLTAAAIIGLAWFARGAFQAASSSNRPAGSTTVAAHSPDVVVHSFGSGARISGRGASGTQIGAGGRVQAPSDGHVLLAFTTGTRVSLEPSGDVTLVENGAAQVLALDHGALRADVAKLAPGRRFLVQTGDAEVEVHGTSFRVSTEPAAASCSTRTLTRVEVFEGVVTVRSAGSEHRIEKDGQWQATCLETAAVHAAAAVVTPPPVPQPNGNDSGRRAPLAPHSASPSARAQTPDVTPTRSDLTEQNDAFAAAVSAERSGDLARAVRGFDALLKRFPTGPLAESAAVQRLKIAHQYDPLRARDLAREYLTRYPTGFAREQALAVLAESP